MGGCRQDTAAGGPRGSQWWWEAWVGRKQQGSPGGAAGAFQQPEHTSVPQLGSRWGPRVSPGSCTAGSCSQLGSEDPT